MSEPRAPHADNTHHHLLVDVAATLHRFAETLDISSTPPPHAGSATIIHSHTATPSAHATAPAPQQHATLAIGFRHPAHALSSAEQIAFSSAILDWFRNKGHARDIDLALSSEADAKNPTQRCARVVLKALNPAGEEALSAFKHQLMRQFSLHTQAQSILHAAQPAHKTPFPGEKAAKLLLRDIASTVELGADNKPALLMYDSADRDTSTHLALAVEQSLLTDNPLKPRHAIDHKPQELDSQHGVLILHLHPSYGRLTNKDRMPNRENPHLYSTMSAPWEPNKRFPTGRPITAETPASYKQAIAVSEHYLNQLHALCSFELPGVAFSIYPYMRTSDTRNTVLSPHASVPSHTQHGFAIVVPQKDTEMLKKFHHNLLHCNAISSSPSPFYR